MFSVDSSYKDQINMFLGDCQTVRLDRFLVLPNIL